MRETLVGTQIQVGPLGCEQIQVGTTQRAKPDLGHVSDIKDVRATRTPSSMDFTALHVVEHRA